MALAGANHQYAARVLCRGALCTGSLSVAAAHDGGRPPHLVLRLGFDRGGSGCRVETVRTGETLSVSLPKLAPKAAPRATAVSAPAEPRGIGSQHNCAADHRSGPRLDGLESDEGSRDVGRPG